MIEHDVKDLSIADEGAKRVEWADQSMPVLRSLRKRFEKEKPFKGIRVSACLHVTTETANLVLTLRAGGAEVRLCASNPLSTQDSVAAYLVEKEGIPVFAIKDEDRDTYYRHINAALYHRPQITMDDGADLISTLHSERKDLASSVIGGTEETTTGVVRLRAMERENTLLYPVIAVNDSKTKFLFDNRYGTGQSTIDGILRSTNFLFAGSTVVVCGYGWCGKGVAMRAKGLGATVIVTECDPIRALEARMDGFSVMESGKAARSGDLFVTVTGNINVLTRDHFLVMKDGAIICNSGHFDVEIDRGALKSLSKSSRRIREQCDEYLLTDGRRIYLLAEGRLINLSAAEGHPAMVMDMSFSNQSLAAEYLVRRGKSLEKRVYSLPEEIDREIALLKLTSMGLSIDTLTDEQNDYISGWRIGT